MIFYSLRKPTGLINMISLCLLCAKHQGSRLDLKNYFKGKQDRSVTEVLAFDTWTLVWMSLDTGILEQSYF